MSRLYLYPHELRPTIHVACFDDWGKKSGVTGTYRVRSHHFLLIQSGRIEAEVEGLSLVGKPGDLICFRSTDVNQYRYSSGTRNLQMQLEFTPPPHHRMTLWMDGIGPLPTKIPMGDYFKDMQRVFETVCLSLAQPGLGPQFLLRASAFEMLAIIASVAKPKPVSLPRFDPWQRVLMQLDTDLSRTISIQQIAEQLGMSVQVFIRRFKTRFGTSPKAYHMHNRLREAARLIYSTDKPIKEIAYMLGFSDPKYFARQFRKYQYAKPSDMRREKTSLSTSVHPYPSNMLIFPPRKAEQSSKWLIPKKMRARSI